MRYFYLCLILILFFVPVLAEDNNLHLLQEKSYLKVEISNGLTLNEAIQLGIGNNLEIKAKESEVKLGEAAIKTAAARQNLFLEGSESRSENTYYGSLNYLIETGGKRKKRIEVAKNRFEAIKKDYESTVWDIRTTVRQLYTKLAVDLEWLKVKEDRVALNEQLVNIAKKRFEAGDVPNVDIKLAQQALLNSRADLISFKNEIVNDRINLNIKLSLGPNAIWPVETAISELSTIPEIKPKQELIDKAITTKPLIKQALFNIQSAQAELRLAKSLRIPNIKENLAVVTSNALNTSTSSPDNFTTSVRADTEVELPIFNRYQGPIAEAKARIEKFLNERNMLVQQIAGDISTAFERLKSVQERLELARSNVNSSKEITDLTQEGYTFGRMNLLQVLTAKQNLKLAQDNFYTTLIDLQNSVGELERSIGLSLNEVTS